MWFSKVFGEELGITVDKVFSCRSARLLREREQLLQREKDSNASVPKYVTQYTNVLYRNYSKYYSALIIDTAEIWTVHHDNSWISLAYYK